MSLMRRQVLKLIGGGLAATPALPVAIPAMLAKASAVAAILPAVPSNGNPLPASPSRLGPVLFSLIQETRLQYEAQTWARRNARNAFGGFDPDLAAMKSWSPATRMRKQMERDAEEALMLHKLDRAMWP